jgi:hypothetical protein
METKQAVASLIAICTEIAGTVNNDHSNFLGQQGSLGAIQERVGALIESVRQSRSIWTPLGGLLTNVSGLWKTRAQKLPSHSRANSKPNAKSSMKHSRASRQYKGSTPKHSSIPQTAWNTVLKP